MKGLFRSIVAAAALLAASTAYAQAAPKWNEDVLNWIPATTCVDGSARTECPGTGFRIETAATSTATTWALVTTTAANALTFTVGSLTAGNHCYRMREEASTPSAYTGVVCKLAVQPAPGAPVFTVDVVASLPVANPDALAYVAGQTVGTVALGVPCDTSRPIKDGKFAVDPAAVTWSTRKLRPAHPVVTCAAPDPIAYNAVGNLSVR